MPDYVQWVTGTIAKALAKHNPWIEPTICSAGCALELLRQDRSFFHGIDLVHFLTPWESKDLLPFFRREIPCVTTIHHVHDWNGVEHNLDADAIMVVSREWYQKLAARGVPKEKMAKVLLGVDSRVFMPASPQEQKRLRKGLRLHNASLIIGFFAKKSSDAMDRKGTDVFLAAIEKLQLTVPRLAAVIVGPGWGDMVESIRSRGIECVWLPFISHQRDVASTYRALDLYWITSRIEGGPITLLEAMSSGVCCISTPVGVAKEVLCHGTNGFFIPFDDANKLAALSCELAARPGDMGRVGHEARRTILRNYQWSQTAPAVRELYLLAATNFSETGYVQSKIRRIGNELPSAINDEFVQDVPLSAIPAKLRSDVRMREELSWARHLLKEGERPAATRSCFSACYRRPMRREPWTLLLSMASPGLLRALRGLSHPKAAFRKLREKLGNALPRHKAPTLSKRETDAR